MDKYHNLQFRSHINVFALLTEKSSCYFIVTDSRKGLCWGKDCSGGVDLHPVGIHVCVVPDQCTNSHSNWCIWRLILAIAGY